MIKYSELEKAIDTLPPTAQKELAEFVRYLQFKYRPDVSGQAVKLEGLWADVDLDVTDEDIRALRQRVTRRLVDKV